MIKTTEVYIFTGFYPSGNSSKWYFDKYRNTIFANSLFVASWSKQPEIGDNIKKVKDNKGILIQVFINNELVYEHIRTQGKEI